MLNVNEIIKKYQEAINAELSKPQTATAGIKFLYPHNLGTYIVRLLPHKDYLSNPKFWARAYFHVQVDPSGEKISQTICRRRTFNEECAICDVLDTLITNAPDHPVTQAIRTMTRRRTLTYFNAIFKGFQKEGDATVQTVLSEGDNNVITSGDIVVLTLPLTVAESVMKEIMYDPVSTIFPETGRDLKIRNMKLSGRTTYSGAFDFKLSPIENWDEIKEKMYDLDAVLMKKFVGKEDAFRIFYGGLVMNKEIATAVKKVALHRNIVGSEVFEQLPSGQSQTTPTPISTQPPVDYEIIQPKPTYTTPKAPEDNEIITPPPPPKQEFKTEPKTPPKKGFQDILNELLEE